MILDLAHKHLNVYQISRKLVRECYEITSRFPLNERYNLTLQVKRAATSIILNLSEGASRKSSLERKRFYEIARGSLVEIDTALQVAYDLNYVDIANLEALKPSMNQCFGMISKMIRSLTH
jgi:four helix bundle protein